jgi:hypothetical protein
MFLQETFVSLMNQKNAPEKPLHYCLRSFRNRALNYRRGFLRRIARELESSRWFERDSSETVEERAAMRCLERLPKGPARSDYPQGLAVSTPSRKSVNCWKSRPIRQPGATAMACKKMKSCLEKESYERFESTGDTFTLLDPAATVGGP